MPTQSTDAEMIVGWRAVSDYVGASFAEIAAAIGSGELRCQIRVDMYTLDNWGSLLEAREAEREQKDYFCGTAGDVATLTYLLGIMVNFPSDEQRARYLLSCNSMQAKLADVKRRGDWCSCGRPASVVLDGASWGPTGYCGVSGMPPLDRCDCGQGAERHDRSVFHMYGVGMSSEQAK